MTLTLSSLTTNKATYDGGSISFDNSNEDVTISQTFVSQNKAKRFGGGVYFGSKNTNVLLDSNFFEGNSAEQDGGGLYSDTENDHLLAINTSFVENTSSGNGGGVHIGSNHDSLAIISATTSNSPYTLDYTYHSDDNATVMVTNHSDPNAVGWIIVFDPSTSICEGDALVIYDGEARQIYTTSGDFYSYPGVNMQPLRVYSQLFSVELTIAGTNTTPAMYVNTTLDPT